MKTISKKLQKLSSKRKLFLSAVEMLGFNVWVQFYYFENEFIHTEDFILFDMALNEPLEEFRDTEETIYITDISIGSSPIGNRSALNLLIEKSGNSAVLNVGFRKCATHKKKMPLNRKPI